MTKKQDDGPTFECKGCASLYAEAQALSYTVTKLRKERAKLLILSCRLGRCLETVTHLAEE